ncbi:hypothetical protein [Flavobacterium sp. LC2016-01]|uniref:hypothetical protein n=1 Tax=Flavobacterium sp. LC2016-01 TaxID=2675876 RepID=UPI0012BA86AA|nr:hypothetical protein [Flavobacterium sp. LC2016-01]MTH13938.1 hypothetical protein [Flavobacterium sp. LC2016-01]
MKRFLVFFFILIHSIAHSQENENKTAEIIRTKESLSNEEFNKIIQTNFSKLITGQSANNIGSYAGVDIEKTEVTFSPTFILKNGNIVTGKMMGGISDGMYSIFNNSKLNTNISLEVQYHFLFNNQPKIIYYYKNDLDKQREALQKIDKEYKDALIKIDSSFDKKSRIIENNQLETDNKTADTKIKKLKKLKSDLKDSPIPKVQDSVTAYRELYDAQITVENIKKKQNQAKITENDSLNKIFNKLKERLKIGNARAERLQENDISKLKVAGYRFAWFSMSAKLKNDDFRLLNPQEPYEKQITKDNYVSYEFKTQYSYINLNPSKNDKTTYLTSSLTMKYKSNFNDLKKVEVSQTNLTGTSSNQTRETVEKYFAYSGVYKTGITEINADIDFYHFPFRNSSIGFHLFPNSKYTENLKPVYNAGFGVVFPFIDKKKDKSTINAELYYNAVNIFNSKDSDYSLIERNNIGIRLVFPISFNLK